MARYQVILAYDGSGFQGYQRQARARTVQGVVEDVLRRLGWEDRTILAAGRTDTGVHASAQVIAFDLDWRHTAEELQAALNAGLPADVSARALQLVRDDFHPRYDAIRRAYCYRIYCQGERHPLLERYAWRVWPAVDLAMLKSAAEILTGPHDFAAFGTPPRAGGSTRRTVFQAEWSERSPELVFEICADAFLYRMIRRLVSLQVEIAHGKRGMQELRQLLEQPPVAPIQGLAPAHGLALVDVCYESDARIQAN
jgi:tRNA pseudouridine38-40 synthase